MQRLNFRHLYYFWSVAKTGHLTRAAGRLHVAQSALSAQIRTLEDTLGERLFEREGRRLRLTPFGAVVLGYADGIFALGQELMATVRGGAGQQLQRLRIGAAATLSRNFVENLLRPVLPLADARLTLESGSRAELLERLKVHELDVVLTNTPVAADARHAWRCQRIARQGVCLVGPPRPASRALRIPAELKGLSFVLPGPSSDIRSQFDRWCARQRLAIDVYAEVDDMAMLRLLARDSGRIAVVPEVVVQDELRTRQLEKYATVPGVHENFYAITTERRSVPPLLRSILAPGPARQRP